MTIITEELECKDGVVEVDNNLLWDNILRMADKRWLMISVYKTFYHNIDTRAISISRENVLM